MKQQARTNAVIKTAQGITNRGTAQGADLCDVIKVGELRSYHWLNINL